jgi:urease accessory protein
LSAPLDPAKFLRLLQLVDSSFPTGAYSFSNGMEGIAAFGMLTSEADVEVLIETQIDEGLAGIELPALFETHRAASAGDLAQIRLVDEILSAFKPIPAFRAASTKVGRRFLESAAPLVPCEVLAGYQDLVREGKAEGHHAIAVGIVFHVAGIDANTTTLAFASNFLHGQIAAALRLGLIGQSAAQRVIAHLQPALIHAVSSAEHRPIDEWGAYQPQLDLAGLLQPNLNGRLFAS